MTAMRLLVVLLLAVLGACDRSEDDVLKPYHDELGTCLVQGSDVPEVTEGLMEYSYGAYCGRYCVWQRAGGTCHYVELHSAPKQDCESCSLYCAPDENTNWVLVDEHDYGC